MAEMIVVGSLELDKNLKTLIGLLDGPGRIAALMQGGFVVERAAKENVQEQELIDTNNLRSAIGTQRDGAAVVIGPFGVGYAAIHEFGGDVHPTVTPKMRGWAWGMFRETGDQKYMGIALTTKAQLDIHIPARPYLRPALDENRERVLQQIGDAIKMQFDALGME